MEICTGSSQNPSNLLPYPYRPLDDTVRDIRIITLLPGKDSDALTIGISHEVLERAPSTAQASIVGSTRLTLDQLRATLPPGHSAHETYDGDFVFQSPSQEWTWKHPVEDFDRSLYLMPEGEGEMRLAPDYEALSYVWGSSDTPEQVVVVEPEPEPGPESKPEHEHEHEHEPQSVSDECERCGGDGAPASSRRRLVGYLKVTANLATALCHLRTESKPRRIWVDAICINQADEVERGRQVKRMATIYSLARRVVVWLGVESPTSELALRNIHQLGARTRITMEELVLAFPANTDDNLVGYLDDLGPLSIAVCDALTELFNREWFSRLWTVQEISLSAQRNAVMQCGHSCVPWPVVRAAVRVLLDRITLYGGQLREALTKPWPLTIRVQDLTPQRLMNLSWRRRCSDPRDKVYAVLGMAPERLVSAVRADYSQDIPVYETYKFFFLEHLRLSERWELMSSEIGSRVVGGPSWVPDWSGEHTSAPWPDCYQASSRGSRLAFTYRAPDVLEVKGLRCATVRGFFGGVRSLDDLGVIRSWTDGRHHGDSYEPTGDNFLCALAITLVAGQYRGRSSSSHAPHLDAWMEKLQWELFGASKVEEDPLFLQPQVKWVYGAVWTRKLVTTDEGYIALAPLCTHPGDIIAVVLGCQSPLVLRPQPRGGQAFQLVGHCFCHGLEHATAFLGPIPRPWQGVSRGVRGSATRVVPHFLDTETMDLTLEDPRLPPLVDWERITAEEALGRPIAAVDPQEAFFFRNKTTGEVMDSDPRMLPDALNGLLRTRGLELETFALV